MAALRRDASGRARAAVERRALAAAARDMVERIGWGDDPMSRVQTLNTDVLHPNQLLANTFQVQDLIAKGGVGEIYRARHRDLRSEHAITIPQPRHALDSTLTALIVNQARPLRSVQHDGVVRCQGLLRDADGRLLLVMDYLRGQTLAERIAQGPLNARELEALAQRLLDALQAIHSQQIPHQDIAPDNIILVEDSCAEATLIDFGLAGSLAAPDDLHVLVDFAGKYAWVSPKQLGLHDGPPDARSDLYSLGLVLAAAACGRRLHMGRMRPRRARRG